MNCIHYKVWDEIPYTFPNFNGGTVDVWERINNFIPHFTGNVITYPYRDWNWSMFVKRGPVPLVPPIGTKYNQAHADNQPPFSVVFKFDSEHIDFDIHW